MFMNRAAPDTVSARYSAGQISSYSKSWILDIQLDIRLDILLDN
jgi:hypothetical protein